MGGPGQGSINLNRPIEMGAFTQDYEYVEGLGDLDQCNGRFGVTLNSLMGFTIMLLVMISLFLQDA